MSAISESSQQAIQKLIKNKRELLALYLSIKGNTWRRLYPETFYSSDGVISKDETKYSGLIYDIFRIFAGSKKELIEDELNLVYMDIEYKARYDSRICGPRTIGVEKAIFDRYKGNCRRS
jgi:hypothetical protein